MLSEHIYINCHGKAAHVSTCQGDCHSHTISCLMSYPFLLMSLFLTFLHVWAFLSYFWPKLSQIWVWVMYFCHHVFSRFNTFLLLSYMGCFKNKDWSRPNKSVVLWSWRLVSDEWRTDHGSERQHSSHVLFLKSWAVLSRIKHTHIYIYVHIQISSNDNLKPSRVWYRPQFRESIEEQSCLSTPGSSERQIRVIADIHRLLMMRNISKEYRDQHVKIRLANLAHSFLLLFSHDNFFGPASGRPHLQGCIHAHPETNKPWSHHMPR